VEFDTTIAGIVGANATLRQRCPALFSGKSNRSDVKSAVQLITESRLGHSHSRFLLGLNLLQEAERHEKSGQ
jgi:hypothetical protein